MTVEELSDQKKEELRHLADMIFEATLALEAEKSKVREGQSAQASS
jgi:hypothetical protein